MTCDVSVQSRELMCQRDPADVESDPIPLNQSECQQKQPVTKQSCFLKSCADDTTFVDVADVEVVCCCCITLLSFSIEVLI